MYHPIPQSVIETTDGGTFPIGTIYCIGRNYADHAREMNATVPDEPIVFIKPPSAYLPDGGTIVAPAPGHTLHHEVEIVAAIGERLHRATLDDARKAIVGYAVGIDVTLRDVQQRAKERGLPWATAKAFATSAPISRIVPAPMVESLDRLAFGLAVNGVVRQTGFAGDMIWSVPELVAYLSRWFILQPGDVVFTGTPDGVGPLADGDRVRAWLGEYVALDVAVHVPPAR
ncbi:MAG: fumarylacetoacetate hydrolase family protein [Chlorobi bacterium]|nr:fumarylacetoacetate hydrolase family protein [Chlorobiota bacterium]